MSSKILNISPEKRNDVNKIEQYKGLIKQLQRQIDIYKMTNNVDKILQAENEINRYENELKSLFEKYGKKYETISEKEEKMLAEIEKEAAQPKQSKVMQLFKEQAKRNQIAAQDVAANKAAQDVAANKAAQDVAANKAPQDVAANKAPQDVAAKKDSKKRQPGNPREKERRHNQSLKDREKAQAKRATQVQSSQKNTKKSRQPVKWLDIENPVLDQQEKHSAKIKQNVDAIYEKNQAEAAKRKAVIEEAIKPELEYCGPALVDPKDNYDAALNILKIEDPNFIQKPNAYIILKNAYDDLIKVCDTGKSKYNKKDYKPNIDKAYALLNGILEKQEEDKLLERVRAEGLQNLEQRKIAAAKKAEQDKAAAEKVAAKKAAQDAAAQKAAEKVAAKKAAQDAAAQKAAQDAAAKKAAQDAAAQKAAEKVAAKKAAQDAAAQKAAQDAAANKAAQVAADKINKLNLSSEMRVSDEENLHQLLITLRETRGLQIYKYICENEPPSLVGIDSPNYNNCYLNALFQMLFHMCYFRRAIIDDNESNFSRAIDELAYILYRYQQLYLRNQYELLFLTDIDYYFIKQQAGLDPLADEQQDPMEILNNDFFNGTGDIANNLIYNNPDNPVLSQYVYQLIDEDDQDKNLEDLIVAQDPNFFNGVVPNTDQKYIILNYPRFQNDSSKKQTNLIANPTVTINNVQFILKGIIVHIGNTTDNGHYIYVTFKNDGGQIDKIYDNLRVTDGSGQQSAADRNDIKQKVLKERIDQFEKLMSDYINTFAGDQQKQEQLKNIGKKVISNDYLLGHNKKTLEDVFETFKVFFNENNPNINSTIFIRGDVNTIDFNSIQEIINRNGAIFLYENISSRPTPVITARGPSTTSNSLPITITSSEKQQLQNTTKAAMSLLEIPSGKTFFQIITIKELTNKRDRLLQKIENNITISPQDEVKQIINNAYIYLSTILDKIGIRSLNHLPLELLDKFYTTLNTNDKKLLLTLSNNFINPYKELNYKKSMIIQRPKFNGTRKIKLRETVCKELGELNPLINSQRGMPSQLRKLTRKITSEEIYKPVKERIAKKELEIKKVEDKKTNEPKNKIEAIEKEAMELQNQKILKRIEVLSQEIAEIKRNTETYPDQVLETDLRFMDKKLREINNLKKRLQSGEDFLNKSRKGGTNKIKEQNKKGTRRLNR
jgi:hypothetical protein